MVPIVGSIWSAVAVVRFCEYEDIVAATERILEDSSWTQIDIRVVTGSLIGR